MTVAVVFPLPIIAIKLWKLLAITQLGFRPVVPEKPRAFLHLVFAIHLNGIVRGSGFEVMFPRWFAVILKCPSISQQINPFVP